MDHSGRNEIDIGLTYSINLNLDTESQLRATANAEMLFGYRGKSLVPIVIRFTM